MKPDDRAKTLAEVTDRLAAVRFGMPAYLARINEWADAGLPGSGNGTGYTGASDPVSGQINDHGHRRVDPAVFELRGFDAELKAVEKAVDKLWDRYQRGAKPREAPAKMADPGCKLCAQVPDHYCRTYVSMWVDVPKGKGKGTTRREMGLCYWCWRFSRPRRNNRLPAFEEVEAHAEGRRVMVARSG